VFLTKSRKANLDANDAAARARAAGRSAQVAAQNAANAARAAAASAQATAQNAAQKSQVAAQNATVAAQNAAQKSQVAAQNAGSIAQTTAAGVSRQVQQGVYTARKWAAPKLEDVADYTAGTIAPTVSSALRNTAAQVRPAEPASPAKRRMKSALAWSLLGAAIAAATGAVAALVRYRQRAAAEIDSQAPDSQAPDSQAPDSPVGDTAADVDSKPAAPTSAAPTSAAPKATPAEPAAPKPAQPPVPAAKTSPRSSANQTDTATDASVNGHANTSGW
jgi:hypothetical protein